MQIDDANIEIILHNLEMAYEYLYYAKRDVQNPDTKRKIHIIKKSISDLYNQLETKEVQYRTTLEEKERIKRLAMDERYRTNYNPNTDGRIKGAYYAGSGDMGSKS